MSTGTLDRRTALLLVLGVAVVLALRFMVFGDKPASVVAASDSIPMTEKRLAKLRAEVATVPGKEKVARVVLSDLAARENEHWLPLEPADRVHLERECAGIFRFRVLPARQLGGFLCL